MHRYFKIDERYEIRVVIAELRENEGALESIGDIYDDLEKLKKEHPGSKYRYGYIVFDTKSGFIPAECNDWNDSPAEAMDDYEKNCRYHP